MLAILLVMLAPPTAAATILDEELTDYIDSSANASVTTNSVASGSGGISWFKIFQIERFQQLHYIVFDFSGARGTMPEGTYEFTYTIQDGDPQPQHGRVHVDYSRNLLNQITATKWTYFFDNWNVSGMTGNKFITTNLSIASFNGYGNSQSSPAQLVEIWGQGSPPAGWNYKVIVSAGQEWENRLTVNTIYGNDVQIQLFRNLNPSTLDIYQDGTKIYSSYESTDATLIFPKNIDEITVTASTGRSYTYPLSLSTPTTSVTTIHIRSAETGALISGARLTILDSQTGTAVVNETLANGAGTFKLEKSNSLRYLAASTAEGYTLLSAIQFDAVDGGTSVTLWMTPDAPPPDPVEDGKSMLYGYAMTQGSQQPISGATVSLDGYGSTTTSSTGFYMFNNVTLGTYDISASAPLHDALSEPVTVDSAPTQHNLALKGHYLLTVTIKDSDTLANVQNATISLSDGQESTQNPATFTADYGPYTITAAAGGYYPQTQSAYLDKPGTTTATVLLTAKPEPIPPPEMPNFPPHNVKFTVQTLLGTPIPGVTVTAQGIQQTPSTNILEALLGLNMTSTPINSELMSGTTDTNGEINFMMVEAVKYQISIYKPDVVNQTLEIYPKEDTYPIIISTAGGPLLPDAGDALRDIHINVTTSTEGDTGHIHIDYNDTTRKTTGLSIQVTQQNTTDSSAPEDVIASHTVANDANVTHTFDLSVYKGQSFFVRLEAQHPDFGTVHRDYAVAFKGVRVPLGPLPDGLYIYVAGFSLMLLGGIFGATSATRGVVVIAFAGWLFWGFGWLDDLGLIAPVSLGLVSTIAVMGVIVTRYREEGYT